MHWRAPPPAVAVVAVGGLFAAAWLLGLNASTGSDASDELITSPSWVAWTVVGALAIVVFVALFLSAIRILVNRDEWGLEAPNRRVWAYLATAFVGVGLIATFILLMPNALVLPINDLPTRTRTVLMFGLGSSVPWLALVWLAHAECHRLEDAITRAAARPAGGGAPASAPAVGDGHVAKLLALWKLLVACVTAFAVAVVAAIISSGALRATFLSAFPDDSAEFPASSVLLYGAFFAVILSVISLPLVAAWRACAFALVERAYPIPREGVPTASWVEDRTRLEKLLHLDVSFLRNPLTALSIFVPLITATLAAFIPQLGSG